MFTLWMAVALLAPSLSAKDANAIKLLDKATHNLYNLGTIQKSEREFERVIPKSSLSQWTRLATIVPIDSPARVEIAFVLAYYDVDSTKNLGVMTQTFSYSYRAKYIDKAQEALERLNPAESDPDEQCTVVIHLLIDKLADLSRRRQARFRSGIDSLLRRDCHSQNPHIAVSARKLLKELKQAPSHWAGEWGFRG